jgi:hypothetical protein
MIQYSKVFWFTRIKVIIIKHGVLHTPILPQPFQPKLHMTDVDFLSITRNGELCDKDGGLGARAFELVMREQVYFLEICRKLFILLWILCVLDVASL